MRTAALILALVVGASSCRKKAESAQGPSLQTDQAKTVEELRPLVEGPVHWWDQTGLCLDVPEGWSGRGVGTGGVLLTIEQLETGVTFAIYRAAAPADRRDLVPVLKDPGSYRDIPVLGAAGVESWTSDVPGGTTLHVWNAAIKGEPIRFEARYPFGRTFTGMTDVERLLRALCVE